MLLYLSFTIPALVAALPQRDLSKRQGGTLDLDRLACRDFSSRHDFWPAEGCRFTSKNRFFPDVKIFTFDQGWTDSADQNATLEYVTEATHDALNMYTDLVPDLNFRDDRPIRVIMTPDPGPNLNGVTKTTNWNDCYVTVRMLTDPSLLRNNMRNVVAHELYHCIQQYRDNFHHDITIAPPSQWWIDGGAEYFANQLGERGPAPYPGLIGEYKNYKTLYDQSYEVSCFFQFLSNEGWSNREIDDVIANAPRDASPAVQRVFLAERDGVGEAFSGFAKQLYDGDIRLPSGWWINAEQSSKFTQDVWNTLAIEGSGTEILSTSASSWSIPLHVFFLPPGARYTINFTPESTCGSKCKAFFRKAGTKDWVELSAQPTDIDCVMEGNSKFEILFTSVVKEEKSSYQFEAVRIEPREEDPNPNCRPKPKPPNVEDTCLKGRWVLDRAEAESYLQIKLAESVSNVGVISNLHITGNAIFDLTTNDPATYVFENLKFTYDHKVDTAPTVHEETTITGTASFKAVALEPGKFKWQAPSGTVNAHAVVSGELFSPPWEFDVSIANGEVIAAYNCTGTRLDMVTFYQGYQNAALVFHKDNNI